MMTAPSPQLAASLSRIKDSFGGSSDLIVRLLGNEQAKAAILYIENTVDTAEIEEKILAPILDHLEQADEFTLNDIRDRILTIKQCSAREKLAEARDDLVNGQTVILLADTPGYIAADTAHWQERSLSVAKSYRTARGPVVGFSEGLGTNLSLLRKTIKNPELRVFSKTLGTRTQTNVAIVYVNGLVDKQVLQVVTTKIEKLQNATQVLGTNYIEEALTGEVKTIFPLTITTDRPDSVSSHLLEGKIAILVDGTPFVLLAPVVFVQMVHAPDDYYLSKLYFPLRLVRLLFTFLAALLPGLYLALTTFHTGLIPMKFLVGIVAQRVMVPLPAFIEMLCVFIFAEIIVQASARLPETYMLLITLFSAIIFGQAAVEAQLIQPITLVVMSVSVLSSSLSFSTVLGPPIRILRFSFLAIGSLFGLYGILLGIIAVILHMTSLRSVGIPYFAPIAPFQWRNQKDALIRKPLSEIEHENVRTYPHEETE